MITFKNKKYELLFSNKLPPLVALNYADELFFREFKKLCGEKYRILSVIRNGWQEKYGLVEDIEGLRVNFGRKINDNSWIEKILKQYKSRSSNFKKLLAKISKKKYNLSRDEKLVKDLSEIRKNAAVLDAMSNMLYLFSVLMGEKFSSALKDYVDNSGDFDKNFIYYTQPIVESRFAKIKIKSLKNKYKLNKIDNNFSKILRVGAFIKDDVSYLLDLRKEQMKSLLSAIAKRMKCRISDVEYFQISEIKKYLAKAGYPCQLVGDRKLVTILFYEKSNLSIFEGISAEKFLEKGGFNKINKINYPASKLKGQPACHGKIKGLVKLAFKSDEVNNMKKGNILVAPYTSVEYLAAMKKAGAIITETGGITSHAAIMSRELNKPCIIGVKNVMTVLQDGDLVEVDADKGIVKIIK